MSLYLAHECKCVVLTLCQSLSFFFPVAYQIWMYTGLCVCVAEEVRHYEMFGANSIYCNPEPEPSRLIIQKMKRKRERLWTAQTPALNVSNPLPLPYNLHFCMMVQSNSSQTSHNNEKFTRPHVVPNINDLLSFVEWKMRYSEDCVGHLPCSGDWCFQAAKNTHQKNAIFQTLRSHTIDHFHRLKRFHSY